MSEKTISCAVVQDLLPLYHDGVLSEESGRLVEAHLAQCPQCRDVLAALAESELEDRFAAESQTVLRRHRRLERRKAVFAGGIIGGVLLVLLMCFGIADWRTNAVLAAVLLLTAALTVVPVVCKKNRLNRTLIAGLVALLVLIFACDILYTGDGWLTFFSIAAVVVYIFSLLFAPLLLRGLPMLPRHRSLAALAWDTLWYFVVLAVFAVDSWLAMRVYGIDYMWSAEILLQLGGAAALLIWVLFLIAVWLPLAKGGKVLAGIGAVVLWSVGGVAFGVWTGAQESVCLYNSDPLWLVVVLAAMLLLAMVVLAAIARRR